jgi:hypothetical protein
VLQADFECNCTVCTHCEIMTCRLEILIHLPGYN